jgi:hypothetical protein
VWNWWRAKQMTGSQMTDRSVTILSFRGGLVGSFADLFICSFGRWKSGCHSNLENKKN